MKNWILNSIFFLIFVPLHSNGQEPVQFNCIEVALNGDVTIWWTPPTNTAGFVSYDIFYSSNGNTFSKIDEISNPLIDHYNHIGANANLASRFYYVNVVYAVSQAASDTLQSMFLQLDNNAPVFNQADLYWNAISNPLPVGSSGFYKIYEEYPLGNWFERSSTTMLTETIEVNVCLDSISFKIEMENNQGCTSVSNISGAIFKDAIYPLKPVFDSVSISNAGEAVLGWQQAISGDVEGYVIYRLENSAWIEIVRIEGRDSVFYTDPDVNPCVDIFTYAIAAFDSCGNKSPGTFEDPLNTILIEKVEFDVCSMSNTISWSDYINASPTLDKYRIFYSIDDGPFSEAGTVSGDQLVFNHSGIQAGSTYTYFVQAVFGNKSSSSCKKSVTTYSYQKPQFIYLANASVLFTNNIELTVEVDALVNACAWEIWSSNENNNAPELINSISKNELASFPLFYTDELADGSLAWYNYYVVVKDSCGNEVLISNTLKTIKLTGSQPNKKQNLLDWNAFEGWEEGVEKYYIFRMIGDELPSQPYDSVGPETLTYTDDIAGADNSNGVFGYWVQAKQNPGNPYGYNEVSNSNIVYLAEETNMYMPNAFKPVGDNYFKPVFKYFSGTNYLFQIYNRWGQLIFETHDPQTGWAGQYQGMNVPLGVYAYRVVYSSLENQTIQLQGTVTVVY